MSRIRLLPAVAAVWVAALACAESPSAPPSIQTEPVEEMESIPGVLESPNLLRSGSRLLRLVGWQTALFKELPGAEVLIGGVIDPSDGALIIREFEVLAVDGLRAFDGTLVARTEGFFIRGRQEDLWLASIPSDLGSHAGRRVWLTMLEGRCVRYGVLE